MFTLSFGFNFNIGCIRWIDYYYLDKLLLYYIKKFNSEKEKS